MYCNNIPDESIQTLIEVLPDLRLTELDIGNNCLSNTACINLAARLPYAKIQYLYLSGNRFNDTCLEALANASIQLSHDLTLIIGNLANPIQDRGIKAFAKAFAFKPSIPIKKINFGVFSGFVSQGALLELFQSIAGSSLKSLQIGPYLNVKPNYNYSVLIPELANAIHQSDIIELGLSLQNLDIQLLSSFLPTHLYKIINLDLEGIGLLGVDTSEESFKALAKVLNQTNIQFLNLGGAGLTKGLVYLADVLHETNITDLIIGNNPSIDLMELSSFVKIINKTKLQYLQLCCIRDKTKLGDELALSLFKGLSSSSIRTLDLSNNNITDRGAQDIAEFISTDKIRHGLWIDYIIENIIGKRIKYLGQKAKLNLTNLYLGANRLQDNGVEQLCKVLPDTEFSYSNFILSISTQINNNNQLNPINTSVLLNCGVFSNGGNSLLPPLPYLLLYRIYQVAKQSIEYNLLKYFSKKSDTTNNEFVNTEKIEVETQKSNIFLDATSDKSNDLITVNLNKDNLLEIRIGNKHLDIDKATTAFRGNVQSNHNLTGGDESLFDVSQNYGTNFIRSGKDNWIRLGFWSKDHVVITENQGTIQIQGFESKDTLHIIESHTIYSEDARVNCVDEISDNNLPIAVIRLKETTVQVINTDCENIANSVRLNDERALHKAQAEVMQTAPTLHKNLSKLCGTFLSSVEKASFITVVPRFVTEIFYRFGSHSREQAEAFGQELQRDLTLAFASSPYSLTASCLATWIASRLIHSPRVISIVAISASLTAVAAETLLTQDISLGWFALNTGVALMGSIVGSSVTQLPKLGVWTFCKAREAKNYVVSKMNFWGTKRENEKFSIKNTPIIEEISSEPLYRSCNSMSSSQFQ